MKLSELKPGDSFIMRSDIEDLLRFPEKDTLLLYTKVRIAGTTNDMLMVRGRELIGINSDERETIQLISVG